MTPTSSLSQLRLILLVSIQAVPSSHKTSLILHLFRTELDVSPLYWSLMFSPVLNLFTKLHPEVYVKSSPSRKKHVIMYKHDKMCIDRGHTQSFLTSIRVFPVLLSSPCAAMKPTWLPGGASKTSSH